MKKWEKPSVKVENFVPNDYVAACWGVGCAVDDANATSRAMGLNVDDPNQAYNYVVHQADHCGLSTNQAVLADESTMVAYGMNECGTDGLGTLSCTVYTDSTYTTIGSYSSINPGDYIYWTTSAESRTWYHQGTVFETYPGHPNRS